jgi:hypothetical protein
VYTICPSTTGDVVQATFLNFLVENNFDFLSIYDGNSTAAPLIGTYTGSTNPGTIAASLANGGCLTFQFTSDASVTDLGWEASISCINSGSGSGINMTTGNSTSCSGNFYDSGGSTVNYSSNENATYTLCPATSGDVTQIAFSTFSLESGFDFLSIYDGNSTASPLIGTFTGVISPGTIAATLANGGCLTFQFTSDGSVNDLGWAASISCITPNGGGTGLCSNCSNPTVINTIPFNLSTTTCGACNDFSSLDACASNYMTGEDYVFSYTPLSNQLVDITLSGTLTWTGFFVTDGCPSSPGSNCIANATSAAGNPSLTGIALTAGTTYYLTVSTWPTPNCSPFVIDIRPPAASCSDGIQNQGETGIDCGGPCPPCGTGGCSDCGNPSIITSLPFNTTSTTCGACNNFSSLNACASLYMGGEDYVFSYTPSVAEIVDITLSGTTTFTGVFVTAGCPTSGLCVGSSTNTLGNPSLSAVSLLAGQNYFIVVSTWPSPDCTPFTLNMNTVLPSCFDGLQNGGETGVDCGGPCPPCTGAATAGDCNVAVNICTNNSFSVDPSGFGLVDELSGNLVSNPTVNPNSIPGNSGCLLSGELNSTWMIINIASNGTLAFELGSPGPVDCFDWIMWNYDANTCNAIMNNQLPPIACNWNGTCNSFTGMASSVPLGGFANNFEAPVNATCGDQFLICFSNYSSALTMVPFSFTGTANVSCSFFNPITVNNPTICEGSCATLTASGGLSYTWLANPDLSAMNSPTVSACPPSAGTFNYTVNGLGTCGNGTAISTVTVLANTSILCNPLLQQTMIEFEAFLNTNSAVDIMWRSQSEANSAYYEVERSVDGIHFETLETVLAAGQSDDMTLYTTRDLDPYLGQSYYRLKLLLTDGQYRYSDLIAIDNHHQLDYFRMFPNPTKTQLILESKYIASSRVSIFNSLGQTMSFGINNIGGDKLQLDLHRFSAGLYTLQITLKGIPIIRKLIID